MPRSRNDPYKRKSAQALNHLAASILDVNDIYKAFEENKGRIKEQISADAERLAGVVVAEGQKIEDTPEYLQSVQNANNLKRYEQYCHDLETVMLGINACREHLLLFVNQVWGLDEDTIKVYLG